MDATNAIRVIWGEDAPTYRVRVIDEGEVLCVYEDHPALIHAYAEKIAKKFRTHKVLTGPKPADGSWAPELPAKRLWTDTVR